MKRKGLYIAIVLLTMMLLPTQAQQLPIFSQYVLNGFILNPSMAGHDGYTSVNTTARQQWLGFSDSPQTVSASWQTRMLQKSHRIIKNPVRSKNMLVPSTKGRVGLGAYVINDANGNVSRTGVQFAYAYHIIMGEDQLSFGLAAKAFQYRINTDNLEVGQDGDLLFEHGLLSVGYAPDVDFGMYWSNPRFFIGASVSNIIQSSVSIRSSTLDFRIERHYWLMAGYKISPYRSDFQFEPSVLLKTTENWIPQGDVGLKVYYNSDYWFGLAFRTDGTLISMAGLKYDGLFVGYSFDYSFSSVQRFNYGTHEISVSYKFGDNARRYRWLRRY